MGFSGVTPILSVNHESRNEVLRSYEKVRILCQSLNRRLYFKSQLDAIRREVATLHRNPLHGHFEGNRATASPTQARLQAVTGSNTLKLGDV